MKILFFFFLFSLNSIYSQTEFSRGYQEGYKKGYCYQRGIGCLSPTPPISPIPNKNESYSSYMDGYNRGFLDGNNKSKVSAQTSPYEKESYKREPQMFTPNYQLLQNNLSARSGSQYSKNNDYEETVSAAKEYFTEKHFENVENAYKSIVRNYESYPKKITKAPDGMYATILASKLKSGEIQDIYYTALVKIKNNEVIYVDYFDPFSNKYLNLVSISAIPLQGLKWEQRITSSKIIGGKGEIFSNSFVENRKFEELGIHKYEFWLFQSTIIYNLK